MTPPYQPDRSLPEATGLPGTDADRAEVAALVRTFFAAFTSGDGCDERLDALPALFLPGALVVRTCGGTPEVLDVPAFVAPRRALLTSGRLTAFREREVRGQVEVFGDVAQYVGSYAKSWQEDGATRTGAGVKTMTLVRTGEGWRIAGAAWDDEREGLRVPEGWRAA